MSAEVVAQAFEISFFYKVILIAMLSSFMVITAHSFLNTRIKKKQEEYARTVGFLGIGDDQAAFAIRAVVDEYDRRSYVVPVASATFVTIFGMFSLLFAADLVGAESVGRNVVLTALFPDTETGRLDGLRWQSMVVLTFAFLGAYIWSCHNIIRRLVGGDLAPIEYFNTALRMIFAPLLSLMLAFLFEATGTGDAMRESMPVIAFMTGMLPGAALHYLQEKFVKLLKLSEDSAHLLNLRMIEGMNRFHEVRLGEIGIDNAQNLAEANIIELILKTPYNPDQLTDWIAQACLYIYVKDEIEQLRRYGIRNAFDMYELAADEQRLAAIGQDAGLNTLALTTVARQINTDPRVRQLLDFHRRLGLEAAVRQPETAPGPTNGADAVPMPTPTGTGAASGEQPLPS